MDINTVFKNEYGYFELIEKPTTQEMAKYYESSYYQNEESTYQKNYSKKELEYIIQKLDKEYYVIENELNKEKIKENKSFLDIGCGEGWAMDYFLKKGWSSLGLDYSDFGCKQFNSDLAKDMMVGDIYINLQEIINQKKTFTVIWLDNVLEHVLDPGRLLEDCLKLVEPKGILMIEVPNDFSRIQEYVLSNGYVDEPFWVVKPDHISYFNIDGIKSLCQSVGWNCFFSMTDYPIDFDIVNPKTNYIKDKSKGKASHKSRLEIESLLHSISLPNTISFYESLGRLGLGREIIAFLKPNK